MDLTIFPTLQKGLLRLNEYRKNPHWLTYKQTSINLKRRLLLNTARLGNLTYCKKYLTTIHGVTHQTPKLAASDPDAFIINHKSRLIDIPNST